ncbi:ABC transporter permease subunit [bacterium]|nr:ABC transporter permease subunit [bacterium]
MRKILTVIRKEYLERVRSKAFIIGTLIGPALMGLIVIGPAMLADVAEDQARTVAVVDATGEVADLLAASLLEFGDDHVALRVLACGAGEACIDELKALVRTEEVDAGVVFPADFFEDPRATFYNASVGSAVLRSESLVPAVDRVLREERFRREGVDTSRQEYLLARAAWDSLMLTEKAEESQNAGVGIIGGIVMVMIIYFMVLVYGQQNLTVVIEEKSSRMVEVLLASLRPEQLMFGKVMGIGLAALTQVAVWTAAGLLVSAQGIAVAGATINLSLFGPWLWINFLLFYFLGYFLYASLFAGIGAMCNSIQDAQQFSGPLTMGLVLPIMLMAVVIKAPDQMLATVLSIVPFFSPILMFMRISVSNPPLWQVLLSWALLVATIWWANQAAGKLFRAGILLYGASPTWASLARALRG